MVVGPGGNPCIPHKCDGGFRLSQTGWGLHTRVGMERMGNTGAGPQSPATRQRIPSPQLLSLMEMLFPGEFPQTLHGTKILFFYNHCLIIEFFISGCFFLFSFF